MIRIVCIGGAIRVLVMVQSLVRGSRRHTAVKVHGLVRLQGTASLESELADLVLLATMVLFGRGCDRGTCLRLAIRGVLATM